MANIYSGGLPESGGKNLFPSTSSDEGLSQPNSGPSAIGTHNGGPTPSTGSYQKDYLTDSGYQPREMQERSGNTPKVCNPDDLSY